MEFWHAGILGAIEGITEFLPISSTGHLILTAHMLSITNSAFLKSFEIIIQLGAILAVIALYPKRLFVERIVMLRVLFAFIPTAIFGLLAYRFIKSYLLDNVVLVVAMLFIGGVFIIFFEKLFKQKAGKSIEELTIKEAMIIGLMQCIAFIPGVSRSGATIFGGNWLGLSRGAAVEFSFLLAVPTMGAATVLDVLKNYETLLHGEHLAILSIGFITAFATAFLAIKFLIRYISNHDFQIFGYYRILVALLLFIFLL